MVIAFLLPVFCYADFFFPVEHSLCTVRNYSVLQWPSPCYNSYWISIFVWCLKTHTTVALWVTENLDQTYYCIIFAINNMSCILLVVFLQRLRETQVLTSLNFVLSLARGWSCRLIHFLFSFFSSLPQIFFSS